MKKIISLIACIALLACIAVPASALSYTVNVTPEKKTMRKGTEQKITVSISDVEVGEGEDFNSVGIEVKLSDGLELVSGEINPDLTPVTEKDADKADGSKTFSIVLAGFDLENNVGVAYSSDLNDKILTLTVKAKEDIEEGEQTVTADVSSQYGETPVSGSCTVKIGNVLIGDIDGDGEITSKDRTILSRHLAEWDGYETLENPDAADVDGDGEITSKDRTILSRYLADWDGFEQYFE